MDSAFHHCEFFSMFSIFMKYTLEDTEIIEKVNDVFC